MCCSTRLRGADGWLGVTRGDTRTLGPLPVHPGPRPSFGPPSNCRFPLESARPLQPSRGTKPTQGFILRHSEPSPPSCSEAKGENQTPVSVAHACGYLPGAALLTLTTDSFDPKGETSHYGCSTRRLSRTPDAQRENRASWHSWSRGAAGHACRLPDLSMGRHGQTQP
jgi:hypothetical protein